jgi:hypothetical protein
LAKSISQFAEIFVVFEYVDREGNKYNNCDATVSESSVRMIRDRWRYMRVMEHIDGACSSGSSSGDGAPASGHTPFLRGLIQCNQSLRIPRKKTKRRCSNDGRQSDRLNAYRQRSAVRLVYSESSAALFHLVVCRLPDHIDQDGGVRQAGVSTASGPLPPEGTSVVVAAEASPSGGATLGAALPGSPRRTSSFSSERTVPVALEQSWWQFYDD